MRAEGWWLVIVSAALTAGANLFLRVGMDRTGGFGGSLGELPSGLLSLLAQPVFDLGIVLYCVAILLWFRVIASEALTSAFPALISLTFLLVTLGAVAALGESMTLIKVSGLAVIVLGIYIVRIQPAPQK